MSIVCNWNLANTRLLSDIAQFGADDILYICDTIQPQEVDMIIEKLGEPAFVVGDNAGFVRYSQRQIYTVPFRGLELEWQELKRTGGRAPVESTDFCFNFLINKKQINRHLLIKLIEFLDIDRNIFAYTWSGVDRNFDLQNIIQEIDQDPKEWPRDFKNQILSPIDLPSRWIPGLGRNKLEGNLSHKAHGTSSWTWNHIFRDLIGRSAVSLITESQQYQISCVFTEKTLYSVMGLTFPIWIGGVGHADYFRSMGFDIFDDVIDHSYQWQPTLTRRCYHAMVDNISILSDINVAQRLRYAHMQRLMANFDLLDKSDILQTHTANITARWPDTLRIPITELWQMCRLGRR